jgi:putative sigma-54 modulation protein
MNLSIQGRHITVTPSLHEHVKDKITKIKDHFDHIIHAHTVLSVERSDQIAEATITVGHRHFHNKYKSEDMYKSIDKLFDKLERQVRRHKNFIQEKWNLRYLHKRLK